jgi:hypothetical protein|tara:strand:- start:518 stop:880 length:363 start_codon:yes stop_codon:yes gene_type:complete
MAEEKKGMMDKIKEKFEDKEEQFEYISVAVRLLVVFWSGLLVTSNYLPKIPGITTGEKQDITFPASLLATALSSFGLEQAKKGNKKDDKVVTNEGIVQTIRVITPLRIEGAEVIDPKVKK